jgi:hypothetical protein
LNVEAKHRSQLVNLVRRHCLDVVLYPRTLPIFRDVFSVCYIDAGGRK